MSSNRDAGYLYSDCMFDIQGEIQILCMSEIRPVYRLSVCQLYLQNTD